MLDCDASFVAVPEFASIRRSLSARLKAATALAEGPADGASLPVSVASQGTERQGTETFTCAARPAFVDSVPAFDMPPIPVPPLADLRAEAAFGFSPADLAPTVPPAAAPAEPEPNAAPAPLSAVDGLADATAEGDARPVTPRRPLRFTAPRSGEEAAPVTLPSFNLFDGVFDDPNLDGPGIDPRLQRSRARARAQLAAMEAVLTPVERNLWHDDDPAPALAPAPAAAATTILSQEAATDGAIQPRRPVRHVTAADLTRRPRPAPQIEDPLRNRLRDLRDILYSPTDEDLAAAAEPPRSPLPQRIADLALRMIILFAGLLLTVLHALPSLSRLRLPALSGPRLAPRMAPRMAMAAAALVAVGIPIGLMAPPDLLPFL